MIYRMSQIYLGAMTNRYQSNTQIKFAESAEFVYRFLIKTPKVTIYKETDTISVVSDLTAVFSHLYLINKQK